MQDNEANRFSARAARYARVGVNVGGVAARIAGARLTGLRGSESGNARALAKALGGLKGPMMKVAQMMATIPDILPPEYAEELLKLQNEAPPMGAAFVKRRMQGELGEGWQKRFGAFDLHPAAAASLGQVHRARMQDGTVLACKLQYPDMASAVEADLKQLDLLFSLHRRVNPAIDTRDMVKEISERVREELDYKREARHAALYKHILQGREEVRVPRVYPELSTKRLLSMDWLEGEKLLAFTKHPQEIRNRIGAAMFNAWWIPFIHYAVIHGDPHFGNYAVFTEAGEPAGINLLDYGCIRLFQAHFVEGVRELYTGFLTHDFDRTVHAYDIWGFKGLTREHVEILNIWARFMYGPLLDDRVRTVADGVSPSQYGRKEAFTVHQALRKAGGVRVPQEFVFMDRAAVGLGGAYLHLGAKLNFYRLFNEALADFDAEVLRIRQAEALANVGLPSPT
ncbi:ABC1 kinase family protein [Beijerinckia indica]|uniref:ABC-1 domain protein n=1 Tax=Beijerinckia indica subsp. indica (strain ATCC 9039 / DSM 1715 / NCIMB 8712) TaxID=395963 RepID=B2IIM6_BEII9|nr:AarF/ABC1/UbiB kinase family protein [Beijerinckia indica]ACB94719.1 ABC-1 domain protein [Beijerinckia indica subsp. indica ATCC 9039]